MQLEKCHVVSLLVMGLFVTVAIVWWRGIPLSQHSVASTNGSKQYQVQSDDSPVLTKATSPEKPAQITTVESAPALATADQQMQWNFTDAQKQEVRDWRRSRGSVTIGSDPEYYSYNLDALRALAENSHDVKAMTVLGQMTGGAEGLKWNRLAAVYGSSDALAGAALAAFVNDPAAPSDVKKARLIEALAYIKVAELRNDYLAASGIHLDVLESQAGVQLTDEDKAMAEQMAQPLYDELEAQRIQLGLGKFDNSVPPVVDAYYRMYDLK